jgi:hypothetical protein
MSLLLLLLHGPLKDWYPTETLNGITTQKNSNSTVNQKFG